ncbi:MAG TPA: hypothetical protein VI653_17475 [Steroidobacteraceae bacterium]
MLRTTRLLLKADGYQVTTATSLTEAGECLRTTPSLDLLITDYHLGEGETGKEAVAAARPLRGSQFKSILLTGDTSAAVRESHGDEPLYFLSKPVSPTDLFKLLGELLAPPDR